MSATLSTALQIGADLGASSTLINPNANHRETFVEKAVNESSVPSQTLAKEVKNHGAEALQKTTASSTDVDQKARQSRVDKNLRDASSRDPETLTNALRYLGPSEVPYKEHNLILRCAVEAIKSSDEDRTRRANLVSVFCLRIELHGGREFLNQAVALYEQEKDPAIRTRYAELLSRQAGYELSEKIPAMFKSAKSTSEQLALIAGEGFAQICETGQFNDWLQTLNDPAQAAYIRIRAIGLLRSSQAAGSDQALRELTETVDPQDGSLSNHLLSACGTDRALAGKVFQRLAERAQPGVMQDAWRAQAVSKGNEDAIASSVTNVRKQSNSDIVTLVSTLVERGAIREVAEVAHQLSSSRSPLKNMTSNEQQTLLANLGSMLQRFPEMRQNTALIADLERLTEATTQNPNPSVAVETFLLRNRLGIRGNQDEPKQLVALGGTPLERAKILETVRRGSGVEDNEALALAKEILADSHNDPKVAGTLALPLSESPSPEVGAWIVGLAKQFPENETSIALAAIYSISKQTRSPASLPAAATLATRYLEAGGSMNVLPDLAARFPGLVERLGNTLEKCAGNTSKPAEYIENLKSLIIATFRDRSDAAQAFRRSLDQEIRGKPLLRKLLLDILPEHPELRSAIHGVLGHEMQITESPRGKVAREQQASSEERLGLYARCDLHPEWGIRTPLRFEGDVLRDLIRVKQIPPELDRRPVARILAPTSDHNNAFQSLNEVVKDLVAKGYRVEYTEVDSRSAFVDACTLHSNQRQADILILAGHGSFNSLSFGGEDPRQAHMHKERGIRLADRDYLRSSGAGNTLKPGGTVFVLSCSNGDGRSSAYADSMAELYRAVFSNAAALSIITAERPTNVEDFSAAPARDKARSTDPKVKIRMQSDIPTHLTQVPRPDDEQSFSA